MALDLKAIRQALRDVIGAIPGVRAYEAMPDLLATSSADATAVIVAGPTDGAYVSYFETFPGTGGALCDVAMRLIAAVPLVDTRAAVDRLDELLSAGSGQAMSLVDALVADKTLGGAVSDSVPRSAGAPYVLLGDDGATRYLAADVDLQLWTRRL